MRFINNSADFACGALHATLNSKMKWRLPAPAPTFASNKTVTIAGAILTLYRFSLSWISSVPPPKGSYTLQTSLFKPSLSSNPLRFSSRRGQVSKFNPFRRTSPLFCPAVASRSHHLHEEHHTSLPVFLD